jgi:hypothetical protein|tara:strand:+ start:18169 stop:18345 length:177 start_codon:yes stop_codon:yes gene_type:complete
MINEIIGKLCPTTILLNVGAIGISMSEIETGLKIIVYIFTILWTALKILNEIKEWKKK